MRLALLSALLCLGCRQSMRSTAVPNAEASADWQALLEKVVTAEGLVDYDALSADREPLDRYVAWLATPEAWPGKVTRDWHAQYLNAYNALVLFQVLERGRPASVRDVPFRFFHWTQFQIGEEWLTLSEIENERIRWKEMDVRDHAALNCASMSCPPLRPELYRAVDLPKQLDEQWRRWINDEQRGVRLEGDKAVFNPIFEWYARDFEFFSAGVDICTLAAAVTENPRKRKTLYDLAAKGCPHEVFEYDWALNDAE